MIPALEIMFGFIAIAGAVSAGDGDEIGRAHV